MLKVLRKSGFIIFRSERFQNLDVLAKLSLHVDFTDTHEGLDLNAIRVRIIESRRKFTRRVEEDNAAKRARDKITLRNDTEPYLSNEYILQIV